MWGIAGGGIGVCVGGCLALTFALALAAAVAATVGCRFRGSGGAGIALDIRAGSRGWWRGTRYGGRRGRLLIW